MDVGGTVAKALLDDHGGYLHDRRVLVDGAEGRRLEGGLVHAEGLYVHVHPGEELIALLDRLEDLHFGRLKGDDRVAGESLQLVQ